MGGRQALTDQNQMMDQLLADLARQAEQAEIYAVESESTQITFEAGELKSSLVERPAASPCARWWRRVGFTASSGGPTRQYSSSAPSHRPALASHSI